MALDISDILIKIVKTDFLPIVGKRYQIGTRTIEKGGIMPKISMTDQWLKKLKPQDKQVDYFDTTLPGLGLRIGKTGKKTWVVMYRVKGQKTKRRLTLKEKYPQLSLKDARIKAKAILVEADKGD